MRDRLSSSVVLALYSAGFLFLLSAVLATTPANAAFVLIDDFQAYVVGYANDNSDAFTSWTKQPGPGPWQPRSENGDEASTSITRIALDGTNKYLGFASSNSARSGYRAVTPIAQGASGIYYFQVYTTDTTPYQSYGLSDLTTMTSADSGFGDFEAYVTLRDLDGTGVTGFNLVGRGGGTDAVALTLASGLAANTWYDIWLDVDNATDTYDVYFGTSGDPNVLGTKVGSGLAFRNGTAANNLVTFMTLDDAGGISAQVSARLDNIYYSLPLVQEKAGTVITIR